MTSAELVYVSVSRNVVALSKRDGREVWSWRSPKGSSYVALLVEDDRLYVSCSGYTFCLNALTGKQLWFNELKGKGIGIPCLASSTANTQFQSASAAAAEEQRKSDSAATMSTTPHAV